MSVLANPGMQVFRSTEDASVNFVKRKGVGYFESRFVQRQRDYYICYLSSQTGCSHGCRMCHLTQTAQTSDLDASLADFYSQANKVLAHGDIHSREASRLHYNFMARGEPMACSTILKDWETLSHKLVEKARQRRLRPRFLISTILPRGLETVDLVEVFPVHHPEVYWSLYSTWPAVRAKWLPKAMDPQTAAAKLARWQEATSKIPKVHFAFIKGQNDCEASIEDIIALLRTYRLHVNFNIVRYNPPDARSEESPEEVIHERVIQLRDAFPSSRVDVVGRVGFDVKASCGMFVAPTA